MVLKEEAVGRWTVPETMVEGFLQTVRDYPDYTAFSTLDGQAIMTWSGVCDRVKALAAGLYRLGVRRGDLVTLMFKCRHEYILADLAALCIGACPFSLYPTLPPKQIIFQLENAACRIAVCEKAFLPQLTAAQELYPELKQIVVLEGGGPEGTIDWARLEAHDPANTFDFEASCSAVRPDDLLTIIYTSGTTGDPKGCEITHANAMAAVKGNMKWLPTGWLPGKRVLGWLPAAHAAERFTNYNMVMIGACEVALCEDTAKVADAVRRYRPQMFFAPPRFWQKIKEALEADWGKLPDPERRKLEEGLQAGVEKVRLGQAGKSIPADLTEKVAEADRSFFASARSALGLDGEEAYFASGSAPIPMAVLEFLHAIGVPVDEGYGISELYGAGIRNPQGKQRLGSVGTTAGVGLETKVASDGELLMGGAAIMRGYRKRPDLTAAAIDAEGWLHTGDLITVDADGYIKIVGRKKDIIINAMGQNMAPAKLENALITAGPFISQSMVVGEGRQYITALLTLDSLFVKSWAEKQDLDTANFAALVRDPKVVAEVQKEVDKANESLARVEQIKKFHIVGGEWLPGMDEVTVTMKIKRPVVGKKYAAEIEAMYEKNRTLL